jgi:hypothetical protein
MWKIININLVIHQSLVKPTAYMKAPSLSLENLISQIGGSLVKPVDIAPIITRADGLCVKLSRRAFCRVSEATDEVVCIVAPYRTSFLCILN